MSFTIINRGEEPYRKVEQEQSGEVGNGKIYKAHKRIFVVQRHLSSVLHYDLRIEVDGVLKSWALPSGPSMNSDDRRLAIAIDDRPLKFASFKRIKNRQNVDGIIESWDKGIFIPHSNLSSSDDDKEILKAIANGRISFTLRGKKLKGVFSLIRLQDQKHWVLLKGNDRYAVNSPFHADDLVGPGSLINQSLRDLNK